MIPKYTNIIFISIIYINFFYTYYCNIFVTMENKPIDNAKKELEQKLKSTKDEKLRQVIADKLKVLGKVICK